MPTLRCANPADVRIVWEAIRYVAHQRQQTDTNRLAKYLIRTQNITQEEAEKKILDCHLDGLLVQVTSMGARGKKRGVESLSYRIPSEIPEHPKHDWYCYECHTAGEVTACSECHRVFHPSCIKSNVSVVNTSCRTAHSNKDATSDVTTGSSNDTEGDSDTCVVQDATVDRGPMSRTVVTLKHESTASNDDKVSNNIKLERNVKNEADIKSIKMIDNDCVIVSSNLVKNSTNFADATDLKPESELNDTTKGDVEESNSLTHCYPCRMLCYEKKSGGLAECSPKEINYLLQFTYERIKTWLPDENLSQMIPSNKDKKSITVNDESWCSFFLVHGFPLTLDKIKDKLKVSAYKSISHFCIDILDILHHIAILFGVSSEEMEAAKYMLADCQYDLAEMRQCRDCYRHSNEKTDPMWFAKPCLPRHELVYAKQKGYTYWPAKVIKIMSDGSYDVRFFGAKHLRALIDPQYVKPIDTSFYDMQLTKRTISFNKAFEELQMHQQLLTNPPGMFTYNAEKSKNVADKLLELTVPLTRTKIIDKPTNEKQKKSKTKKVASKSKQNLNPKVQLNKTIDLGSLNSDKDKTKNKTRMTRNSLMTALTMNVYDINRVSEDENLESEDESVSSDYTPNKIKLRKRRLNRGDVSMLSGKKSRKSASKFEIKKARRTCGPSKRSVSPHIDVVELCDSSEDEGSVRTLKIIDYNSDTSAPHSSQEALISSTQEITAQMSSQAPRLPRVRGGGVSRRENLERIRLEVASAPDVQRAAQLAHEALLAENERWESELQTLVDEQVKAILAEVKKRQWCFYCGDEAIYYCCWNTAYCSTTCQQQHWQSEHKRVCRRKR